MNPIPKLTQLGQSLWYDNIQRRILENGEFQAMIERGDIRGVTSNPSIFMNAIAKTNDYDSALMPLAWAGWDAEKIFWQLAIEDIKAACDAFAPAMALAVVIGRFGCFLSGEDGLGTPTALPWGVWIQTASGALQRVHPAPLYDAAFNLTWFIVLLSMRDHPRMQNGNLLKFGLGGYCIFRFFVEFVRNNRIILFGLTGQQYFCLGLLALIGLYYSYQYAKSKNVISIENIFQSVKG